MAAYDIQKHFKGLRVDTGRRRSRRDPFADPFEDDSDDDRNRRSRSKTKQPPSAAAEKEKPPSTKPSVAAAPAKSKTNTSPKAAPAAVRRDSEDEFLDAPKRTDRRPSPAPAQLASLRVSDGAGRRGSLDQGLQGKSLLGRNVQTNRASRSAVAQAAGALAYLDDSSEEEEEPRRPSRSSDRAPSPAPRKSSDTVDLALRSPTPKGGVREPLKEPAQPPKHTVASPFAGTKYLQDSESDTDEDAVSSRSNSIEGSIAPDHQPGSPEKDRLEVKRVDKPKAQNGGGMSWRAFSAGRAEQRNTEIEALQASLRSRGKSISFGTHAVTDDGNRVPVTITPDQIFAGTRGRRKGRGKSPPRRNEDAQPDPDEVEGGERPDGIYDPAQFKTNPFSGEIPMRLNRGEITADMDAGEPVRRTVHSPHDSAVSNGSENGRQPGSPHGSIPDIRVNDIVQ